MPGTFFRVKKTALHLHIIQSNGRTITKFEDIYKAVIFDINFIINLIIKTKFFDFFAVQRIFFDFQYQLLERGFLIGR